MRDNQDSLSATAALCVARCKTPELQQSEWVTAGAAVQRDKRMFLKILAEQLVLNRALSLWGAPPAFVGRQLHGAKVPVGFLMTRSLASGTEARLLKRGTFKAPCRQPLSRTARLRGQDPVRKLGRSGGKTASLCGSLVAHTRNEPKGQQQ